MNLTEKEFSSCQRAGAFLRMSGGIAGQQNSGSPPKLAQHVRSTAQGDRSANRHDPRSVGVVNLRMAKRQCETPTMRLDQKGVGSTASRRHGSHQHPRPARPSPPPGTAVAKAARRSAGTFIAQDGEPEVILKTSARNPASGQAKHRPAAIARTKPAGLAPGRARSQRREASIRIGRSGSRGM